MNSVFHYRLFGLDKLKPLPVHTTHVMIQLVATRKVLREIFAVVHKHSTKMNILNMFSQVTSVRADFASVTLGTILHNIFIQLLRVLPCKNQL